MIKTLFNFSGAEAHSQLSPNEAGLVFGALRDKGEDRSESAQRPGRRPAGSAAHAAR